MIKEPRCSDIMQRHFDFAASGGGELSLPTADHANNVAPSGLQRSEN